MTLEALLEQVHPQLTSFLGEGYEKKPVATLSRECRRKGRAISRTLKPFAKSGTFPETYNPRAIHALFAAAFLYYSPQLHDFIRVVRLKSKPRTVNHMRALQDSCEFVVYMLETFAGYEYLGQFQEKTIRLYDEMNTTFIQQHLSRRMSAFVDDQLVVVIDFMNPVEHIQLELERLLNKIQMTTDSIASDMASKENLTPLREDLLPSRYAMPLQRKQGGGERYPTTYLPEWYEALKIHRLKLLRHKEKSIIRWVYGTDPGREEFATRKTTSYNRAKLAERLMFAALHRAPMTAFHTSL